MTGSCLRRNLVLSLGKHGQRLEQNAYQAAFELVLTGLHTMTRMPR